MTAQTHQHDIEIVVGDQSHDEFFFEAEVETTFLSLSPDQSHISREELAQRLRATHEKMFAQSGHIIFVARDRNSGENLGLLWFGPRFDPISCEDQAWIFNITVVPAHRGCGIGKILMKHAENYAAQNGFSSIGLTVSSHNENARALYQKMDYAQTNILMRKNLEKLA